jgi:hypothetical protein
MSARSTPTRAPLLGGPSLLAPRRMTSTLRQRLFFEVTRSTMYASEPRNEGTLALNAALWSWGTTALQSSAAAVPGLRTIACASRVAAPSLSISLGRSESGSSARPCFSAVKCGERSASMIVAQMCLQTEPPLAYGHVHEATTFPLARAIWTV